MSGAGSAVTKFVFVPGRRFNSSQGWPVYSVRATSSAVIGVIKPREEFNVTKTEGDYVKLQLKSGTVGWALAVVKGTRYLHPRHDPGKPPTANSNPAAHPQQQQQPRIVQRPQQVRPAPPQSPRKTRTYGWQRSRGKLKNYEEVLEKRREQLRQVELDKHPQLLDEWFELIKELDAVLRYGFSSRVDDTCEGGKRKRSNTFLGLFKPAPPVNPSARKGRANSFGYFSKDDQKDPKAPSEKPAIDRATQLKLLAQQRRLSEEKAQRASEIEEKIRQAAVQRARMQLMEERAGKAVNVPILNSPKTSSDLDTCSPRSERRVRIDESHRVDQSESPVRSLQVEPTSTDGIELDYRTDDEESTAVPLHQIPSSVVMTARQGNRQQRNVSDDTNTAEESDVGAEATNLETRGQAMALDAEPLQTGSTVSHIAQFDNLQMPQSTATTESTNSEHIQGSQLHTSQNVVRQEPCETPPRRPEIVQPAIAPSPRHAVREDAKKILMEVAAQQQQEQRDAVIALFDTAVATADDEINDPVPGLIIAPDPPSEAASQAVTPVIKHISNAHNVESALPPAAQSTPEKPDTRHQTESVSTPKSTAAISPPSAVTSPPPIVVVTDDTEENGPLTNPEEIIKALDTPKRKKRVSRAAARLRAAAVAGIRNKIHEDYLDAYAAAQSRKAQHHNIAKQVAREVVERQRDQAFALLARKRQEEDIRRGMYAKKMHAVRQKNSILISF